MFLGKFPGQSTTLIVNAEADGRLDMTVNAWHEPKLDAYLNG